MSVRNGKLMVLIDTNIFLRILVKENKRVFEESRKALELIEQAVVSAYTNTIVLTEIQFVLTSVYRYQRQAITEALEAVVAFPSVKLVDDTDAHLAVRLYGKTQVKFADCLLASSRRVQEGKAAILSYDRDFDRLGVRRLEPRDLLKKRKR